MFQGFRQEMIDFFWALRFNNRRDWFQEHKKTYTDEVYEPMKALARHGRAVRIGDRLEVQPHL